MARKFRPNPRRQAILVILALVGLGIGYGAGYLFKPNPPSRVPTAADTSAATQAATEPETKNERQASNETVTPAPAPMMPEENGGAEGAPYRAYEESLPKDILENGGLPVLNVIQGGDVADGNRYSKNPAEPAETVEPKTKLKDTGQLTPDERVVWADSRKSATETPQKTEPSVAPRETASLPAEPAPVTPTTPEPQPAEPGTATEAEDPETVPTWRKNAVEVTLNTGPMVAIVIDDMGVDRGRTRRAWTLKGPLTLSFLTYAKDITDQMADARDNGHELMLHVPMEPSSADVDPGPNVLITGMPREEILANLNWTLDQADGYVGINNHMGSRFTSELTSMTVVMETLKERGLLFLDSVTSPKSAGRTAAKALGVPFIARNIFLDHVDDVDEIRGRLKQTTDLAKRRGYAVAIGHPRDATIEALAPWLEDLPSQGIQLVPLSAILMRVTEHMAAASSATEPTEEAAEDNKQPEPGTEKGPAVKPEPQTAQQTDPQSADDPAPEQESERDKP